MLSKTELKSQCRGIKYASILAACCCRSVISIRLEGWKIYPGKQEIPFLHDLELLNRVEKFYENTFPIRVNICAGYLIGLIHS